MPHQRSQGHQPHGLRHLIQTARHHRVGINGGTGTRGTGTGELCIWVLTFNPIVSLPRRVHERGYSASGGPRSCARRGNPPQADAKRRGALSWGYPFFGRQRTGTKKECIIRTFLCSVPKKSTKRKQPQLGPPAADSPRETFVHGGVKNSSRFSRDSDSMPPFLRTRTLRSAALQRVFNT